jgi:hypothetical protein
MKFRTYYTLKSAAHFSRKLNQLTFVPQGIGQEHGISCSATNFIAQHKEVQMAALIPESITLLFLVP